MNTTTLKSIPGPGLFATVRGIAQHGFLSYIHQLWQTYGDLFEMNIGPRKLIFAVHPEAVRHINVTHRQDFGKGHSYDAVRRYVTGDGLVTSNGALWLRQRRLMAPFFTPKAIQVYAELMLRDGARMHARWGALAQSGQTVEIGEEMTYITAAIILRAMFSAETDEAITEMKQTVQAMLDVLNVHQQGFYPPAWVPTPLNRRYQVARKKSYAYIQGLIAQRRALPEDQWPDDLLTRLMLARDEDTGEPMTERLLHDESLTIFFAGHETTARTLSFTWYALANNPTVAARLHGELDTVLGDRDPTLEDLHHLPYTLQVIKEVLRLYPAVPFYARDAMTDTSMEGYAIPKNGSVMFSSYLTHRHPDFWPNPTQFDPERWTPEREAAQHPYAYHPFAAGPRICLGNNFSLLESHILLAQLARRFAPRLQPANHVPRWEMQGTLGPTNGLPMRIERR